ncbi:MAG: hypothetical protein K0S07_375 [Chlamydiales bacterium]|nr:hypothetical protein [Chlamydiales bacterium]
MLKQSISKIAFSMAAITMCFGAVEAAPATTPAPASYATMSKTTMMVGAGVIGAAAGAVAGKSAVDDGKDGAAGATGATGPAGAAGATGATGAAGTNFTFPTGTATYNFSFTETGAVGDSNVQGVVITPSQQVLSTPVVVAGAASNNIISINNAEVGKYTVLFYQATTGLAAGDMTCTVTNTDNGVSHTYTSSFGAATMGLQDAYEFVYDPAAIY